MVEAVGSFVLEVARRRLRSCTRFSGLPGCFVGLASALCRDDIYQRLKLMHTYWHAIQDFHERFWNILLKRSGMSNVEEMFALLRRSSTVSGILAAPMGERHKNVRSLFSMAPDIVPKEYTAIVSSGQAPCHSASLLQQIAPSEDAVLRAC